jgi:predicted nucleic acid-binding Zn ribbon protein
MPPALCDRCNAPLPESTRRRRFCSDKCRAAAWQVTRKERLARLEDRLSVALAEVQALRRSYVQR